MKRIQKTKLSFNDLSFRIPGLVLCVVGILAEIFLFGKEGSSVIQVTESIRFSGFLAMAVLGLAMFCAPYVLMAYDIYKKGKEVN